MSIVLQVKVDNNANFYPKPLIFQTEDRQEIVRISQHSFSC